MKLGNGMTPKEARAMVEHIQQGKLDSLTDENLGGFVRLLLRASRANLPDGLGFQMGGREARRLLKRLGTMPAHRPSKSAEQRALDASWNAFSGNAAKTDIELWRFLDGEMPRPAELKERRGDSGKSVARVREDAACEILRRHCPGSSAAETALLRRTAADIAGRPGKPSALKSRRALGLLSARTKRRSKADTS